MQGNERMSQHLKLCCDNYEEESIEPCHDISQLCRDTNKEEGKESLSRQRIVCRDNHQRRMSSHIVATSPQQSLKTKMDAIMS